MTGAQLVPSGNLCGRQRRGICELLFCLTHLLFQELEGVAFYVAHIHSTEALPFSFSTSSLLPFIVSFPPLSPSIAAAVSTVLGATGSEREPAYLQFVPAEGEIESL